MRHGQRAGLIAATLIYRWNLANGILSIVFSALTFLGVFAILLGPQSLLYLGIAVLALMLGLGTLLDRVVKFWHPQSTVATMRNPYLVAHLYQKELVQLRTSTLPQLEALRLLLTFVPFPNEPKYAASRDRLVMELDASIARTRDAIADKKWEINSDERTY